MAKKAVKKSAAPKPKAKSVTTDKSIKFLENYLNNASHRRDSKYRVNVCGSTT
jgi:hypothetical protein